MNLTNGSRASPRSSPTSRTGPTASSSKGDRLLRTGRRWGRLVFRRASGGVRGRRIRPAPTWIAGIAEAKPGIKVFADPSAQTQALYQGWAPKVDWNDYGRLDEHEDKDCVTAGCFSDVFRIAESSDEEPGIFQLKSYAKDIGEIRTGARGGGDSQEDLALKSKALLSGAALAKIDQLARDMETHAYKIEQGRLRPDREDAVTRSRGGRRGPWAAPGRRRPPPTLRARDPHIVDRGLDQRVGAAVRRHEDDADRLAGPRRQRDRGRRPGRPIRVRRSCLGPHQCARAITLLDEDLERIGRRCGRGVGQVVAERQPAHSAG